MKKMKKVFTCVLILSMIMSFMSVPAFADDGAQDNPAPALPTAPEWPLLEGEKDAELISRDDNSYEVTVKVPGGEGIKKYDEVVVMVDGSYSMDTEWDDMKEALVKIGDTVLNGSGSTKLSLMAFGMSPNVVFEDVNSSEEMEAELPELPGGLLYGRSSTNCHAAFIGLREYVEDVRAKAGDKLNNVYVVFLSDGQVNQYAEPVEWYSAAMKLNPAYAAYAHSCEMDAVLYGGKTSSPESIEAFGDALEETLSYYKTATDGYIAFIEAGGNRNDINSGSKLNSMINKLTKQKSEAEAVLADNPAKIAAAELELEGLIANLPEGEDPELNEGIIAKKAEIEELKAAYTESEENLPVITVKLSGLNDYVTYTELYEACQNAKLENNPTLTRAQYYVQLVWNAFYEATGRDKEELQPVHVMETAFLKYQESLGRKNHIEDAFYYTAATLPISNGSLNGPYAAKEAAALAGEVDGLYMVRYGNGGRSGWMTDIEGTKFTQSSSISTLTSALEEALADLVLTPYNDVVITDYMSKWVNLRPETIKIVDREGNTVAEFDGANSDVENGVYKYMWTGTPLCAEKDPIVLEKAAPEDYAAGGSDVVGNTSGDIYKITWNVKDGPLYRADSYSLVYEVTVDTAEKGFKHNEDYPANGNTDLGYTDENSELKTNDIDVPDVTVPKASTPSLPNVTTYTVTVNYFDKETGEKIAESYTSAPIGELMPYDVTDKNAIEIEDYVYDSTSGDALTGVMDSNKVVNVYYVQEIVIIEDPDVPLDEEPLVEVEDPDVPKTDIPDEEEPPVEIEEPDVPLSDVPKTADNTAAVLWMMMALLSAAVLMGIRIAERKER